MKTDFYTYAFLRETGTPYYIGKGRGRRCFSNEGRCSNVPKDRSRILILKRNLTEQEAFKHEIYMIAVFGRKDIGTGILINKTDGGEGISGCRRPDLSDYNSKVKKGSKLSEETKLKLSEALTGRVLPCMSEVGSRNMTDFHRRRREDPELDRQFRETCARNGREQGRINGGKNKGKKHSPEVNAKKGSPREKNPLWGKIRITNGIVNRQIEKDEPIPEGFWRGMTRNKKKVR